jgi:hypothetical protein
MNSPSAWPAKARLGGLALAQAPLPFLPQDRAGPEQPLSAEELQLVATLAEQGVRLEPRLGLVAIPATVVVVDDLLE